MEEELLRDRSACRQAGGPGSGPQDCRKKGRMEGRRERGKKKEGGRGDTEAQEAQSDSARASSYLANTHSAPAMLGMLLSARERAGQAHGSEQDRHFCQERQTSHRVKKNKEYARRL